MTTAETHPDNAAPGPLLDTIPTAQLRGCTKRFGEVTAIADVDLVLHPGQVHALVGENGAGKSTIVRLLSGAHSPDDGTVLVAGAPLAARPAAALAAGVATIYQDRALVPQLTVAENILLGHEPAVAATVLRRGAGTRLVAKALRRVDAALDPETQVADLSVADAQLVAIAKALSLDANLLIFDEPTAALTDREAERLFRLIEQMRTSGLSILYITHRLHEVERLADEITVLRDGRVVTRLRAGDVDRDGLIALMIGRQLGNLFPDLNHELGADQLVVTGLTGRSFRNVDLTARQGEIVGLAGLDGSGRSSVAAAIAGAIPVASGQITVSGRPVPAGKVWTAQRAGITYLPPDRRRQGIFPDLTVTPTVTVTSLKRFTTAGFLRIRRETRRAVQLTRQLRLKGSVTDRTATLSGGNQQKVLLARALCQDPHVLVLDEPTAGVDIGARADIYTLVGQIAQTGHAVVVASSDVMELLGICHRIIVLREGAVSADFDRGDATEALVVAAQIPDSSPTHTTLTQRRGGTT